ncbi:MAG: malectin domain-containing carbohydrate-binding protein [Sphingomonas fennica]
MRLGLHRFLLAVAIATPAMAAERYTQKLSDGWQFRRGAQIDAASPTSAEGWVSVSVPHSWNRVGYYLSEPAGHLNSAANVDKYQGIGWYRLSFDVPAVRFGDQTWLEFGAASRTAEVWLNGRRLGAHDGGFSTFRLNATDAVKSGARNDLLVKVDNTQPEPGSATADILPLAGDFFVHGGLYRPVTLIRTAALHIDMLDDGGPGVYATTRSIADGRAQLDVRVRLRNDGPRPSSATMTIELRDTSGRPVASVRRSLGLAAGRGTEVTQTVDVSDPHLWNGIADPYLYTLSVAVNDGRGGTQDRVEQSIGIRQMQADPVRGFLLNGRPLRLHGVGYHQDREGKGWAVSAADVEQDFAIMREMGVNTIRLTHYQHGPVIHDLADRYGLILWDEIPLVSKWTMGEATVASDGLRANARQQLRELIRQNANHPSVFSWGIANEVDFGKSVPAFISTRKDAPAPDPFPLLKELRTLADEADPSRPTTLATCCEGRLAETGEVPITATAAALGGANRYFGWYYGAPDDLGPHLDALHSARPTQPLSVTEYGAGGALSIHTDNPLGGSVDARGRDQPEEYESFIHERAWPTLAAKPYLWATWLWNSFDFATTVRREGDAIDINTKGLVSYDRTIRKDAYYFYKANWSDQPAIHITGRRYVDRAYAATDIRVYSNAPRTELMVNGRSAGTLGACPNRICIWPNVRLATGANRVVARGLFPDGTTEDAVDWRLSPEVASAVRIDSGALVAGAVAGKTYGSDTFFEGGKPGDLNAFAGWGPKPPPKIVTGTREAAVVDTYREGRFAYHIPLVDGRYTVSLTFVEPALAAGARRFDVTAGGRTVVNGLDIAATAGGPLKAVQRTFQTTVRGGRLDLAFVPRTGDAIVSAIEITR